MQTSLVTAPIGTTSRRWRVAVVCVVSVDSNVLSFDPTCKAETNVASMNRVMAVKAPPIKSTIYAR